MKRILTLLMTVSLLLCLAACGQPADHAPEQSPQQAEPSEPPAQTEPPALEGEALSVLPAEDAGLAEEDAVQNLPGVVSAQLRRSRLTIRFKAPTKCEEAAVMAKTNANADYRALAKAIIENIGGKSNITFAAHCMTRLRLNLQDESKFDTDKVKAIPGLHKATRWNSVRICRASTEASFRKRRRAGVL